MPIASLSLYSLHQSARNKFANDNNNNNRTGRVYKFKLKRERIKSSPIKTSAGIREGIRYIACNLITI